MQAVSLTTIGWFYTLISIGAIGIGAYLIMALHRAGNAERDVLARNVLNDTAMFAVWFVGLAGGIGLINGKPWARGTLEFFCWVLIVLLLLSVFNRLAAIHRLAASGEPINWTTTLLGAAFVAVPVLLICGGTIVTLRGAGLAQ